jgi:hypothetical protein
MHFLQDHLLAYDGDVETMLHATFMMLQDRVYIGHCFEKALTYVCSQYISDNRMF